MPGTGRFNLAQGAIATTMGIATSTSALAAGVAVGHFGYSVSFLAFGAAAAVAFFVFSGFMPETRYEHPAAQNDAPLSRARAAAGE